MRCSHDTISSFLLWWLVAMSHEKCPQNCGCSMSCCAMVACPRVLSVCGQGAPVLCVAFDQDPKVLVRVSRAITQLEQEVQIGEGSAV